MGMNVNGPSSAQGVYFRTLNKVVHAGKMEEQLNFVQNQQVPEDLSTPEGRMVARFNVAFNQLYAMSNDLMLPGNRVGGLKPEDEIHIV